jgi:hypothetical protein
VKKPPPDVAALLARLDPVPLEAWRDLCLTRKALAGDLPSAVEWLAKHGDDPAAKPP